VVYHPTLRRVVGIALELYHQGIVANGGLAGRFDVLLRQWQELEALNQQAIDRWDKRLGENIQPDPTIEPTHSDNHVIIHGGVQGNVIHVGEVAGDLVLRDKISGNKTVHK